MAAARPDRARAAAGRKQQSGFYVNFIFQSDATALPTLHGKFRLNEDILRVIFTEAGPSAGKAA